MDCQRCEGHGDFSNIVIIQYADDECPLKFEHWSICPICNGQGTVD